MDVRKCGRMEAQYVHTSIRPNFHTRTELAEFVLECRLEREPNHQTERKSDPSNVLTFNVLR